MAGATTVLRYSESAMASSFEQIFESALALSRDERQELVAILQDSLGEGNPDELEAAWSAEIARRRDELRRGEVTPIPADAVLQKYEALLANARRRAAAVG